MSVPLKRARSAGFTAWLIRANTFYHCTDKSQNIAALSRAGPGIVTSARCKLSAVLLFTDQTWGDPRPAGSWSGEPSSPCPLREGSVALGMLQPRGREERSCFAMYPHGTAALGVRRRCTSPRGGAVPAFLAGRAAEGPQPHGRSPVSISRCPEVARPACLRSLQEHNRTAKQRLRTSGPPVFHIMLHLKAGFLHYIHPDRYHEIHHSFRYGSRPLEDELRGAL